MLCLYVVNAHQLYRFNNLSLTFKGEYSDPVLMNGVATKYYDYEHCCSYWVMGTTPGETSVKGLPLFLLFFKDQFT